MVRQPERCPPWCDSSSAVPELTHCHPTQPFTVPSQLPLLSHHQEATNQPRTCVSLRPAALCGRGGQRGDGSSSCLASRHRQRPRCCQSPGPVPGLPGGAGTGPASSQRPSLAAGGAGSAGFRQKPARTQNGPAGRGSIWAELTTAQRAQHREPHTPRSAPHTPWSAFPGSLTANKAPATMGPLIPLQGPCSGLCPAPGDTASSAHYGDSNRWGGYLLESDASCPPQRCPTAIPTPVTCFPIAMPMGVLDLGAPSPPGISGVPGVSQCCKTAHPVSGAGCAGQGAWVPPEAPLTLPRPHGDGLILGKGSLEGLSQPGCKSARLRHVLQPLGWSCDSRVPGSPPGISLQLGQDSRRATRSWSHPERDKA